MALGHVNVAVWSGHNVDRVGQGIGRTAGHAELPQRHEDLALRAELDHHAAFVFFSGKRLELFCGRASRVSHPHISILVDVETMRPHEHASAEAREQVS